jgi:hypothetical protein
MPEETCVKLLFFLFSCPSSYLLKCPVVHFINIYRFYLSIFLIFLKYFFFRLKMSLFNLCCEKVLLLNVEFEVHSLFSQNTEGNLTLPTAFHYCLLTLLTSAVSVAAAPQKSISLILCCFKDHLIVCVLCNFIIMCLCENFF